MYLRKRGGCSGNEVMQRYFDTVTIKKEMGLPLYFPPFHLSEGKRHKFHSSTREQCSQQLHSGTDINMIQRSVDREEQEQTRIHMDDWEACSNPDFTLKDDKYERGKVMEYACEHYTEGRQW